MKQQRSVVATGLLHPMEVSRQVADGTSLSRECSSVQTDLWVLTIAQGRWVGWPVQGWSCFLCFSTHTVVNSFRCTCRRCRVILDQTMTASSAFGLHAGGVDFKRHGRGGDRRWISWLAKPAFVGEHVFPRMGWLSVRSNFSLGDFTHYLPMRIRRPYKAGYFLWPGVLWWGHSPISCTGSLGQQWYGQT